MKNIILNNKIEMPVIGLGTYMLLGNTCEKIVYNAINIGYRLIDTASWYNNEIEVGNAIKKSGISRDELFIITKISGVKNYDEAIIAIEESLKRLGVEYVDLLLIHWPEGNYLDVYRAMEYYYKIGKIKAIGVSNFNEKLLKILLDNCEIKPSVNQIETHIYWQQNRMNKFMKKNNIIHMAWSQFGEGYLNVFNDELIQELSKKYNKSPAQIILKFFIKKDIVVIPRTSNINYLKENIDVFDFDIDDDDMKKIEKLNCNKSVSNWPSYMNENNY